MPIQYDIGQISEDLEDFQISLRAIDMDKVKERTLERVATEMTEMVRQAVVAENDIISPAMNSPNDRGDGPSMSTRDAWIAEKSGANRWTVRPHPSVRQRAVVLNFGYPGTITPTSSEFLWFEFQGHPISVREVEGPDETGYWQAAFQRIESSDRLQKIASEELEEEFEDSL